MTMPGAKSRRDRMVVAIVVVVALYALAALMWFTGRRDAWERSRKDYKKELARTNRGPPRAGSASSSAWPRNTT